MRPAPGAGGGRFVAASARRERSFDGPRSNPQAGSPAGRWGSFPRGVGHGDGCGWTGQATATASAAACARADPLVSGGTRVERVLRAAVVVVLVAAGGAVAVRVAEFGRTRFFTIDEYQFGHATWLVSQGQRPYVDFYEHHFPLGYVLHAPLLWPDGSFAGKARRLRAVPLVYLAGLALALGLATRAVTRDTPTALLAAILPVANGFGLMSAVDYRADGFAACLFLASLAGLEANRTRGHRGLAAACGAGLALAVGMTQKMVYLAGGSLLALAILQLVSRRAGRAGPPLVARPGWVLGTMAALGAAGLAVAAALGLVEAGFQRTVAEAFAHEAAHPEVPVTRFLGPYLAGTGWSTAAFVALAAAFLALDRGRFWIAPVVAVALGTSAITARYPYNYVLPALLLGVCAARGAGLLARRLPLGRAAPLRPLLWLLPLALVPAQLAFVAGTSTNAHQLALLDKVERFTGPGDPVIDDAGGALFRPHGSYYWYQGGAHRQIFADYFEHQLARDYRESRALLWIRDLRLRWLPEPVRALFREHYVRADGDLYALGFRTPRTGSEGRTRRVDVLRAGAYHVFPDPVGGGGSAPHPGLRFDGRAAVDGVVELEEGPLRIEVPPHAAPHLVTPLARGLFVPRVIGERTHAPLFEYDRPRRGEDGT